MLVLAIDTATPSAIAGIVELSAAGLLTRAERVNHDPRGHAETLVPNIEAALADAGIDRTDLDAVVVGSGPGPFTGLRVGMATAEAFADALGIAVYPVMTLDAIALRAERETGSRAPLLVVTDARRREVYWARYEGGLRVAGPGVDAPGTVAVGTATRVAGSPAHAALFALPVVDVAVPDAAALVGVAADAVRSSAVPEPLEPQYPRRPDAVAKADWGR